MNENEYGYLRPLMTPQGAYTLGVTLGAYREFRETHNMKDPKVECCEQGKNLIEALNALLALMEHRVDVADT